MAYWTGTLLASPIVRGSSGDTYGTHHSILGIGGYMEVNNLTERNAIPVDVVNGIGYDGISSGQRRLGMLVYVHADDTIYQLYVAPSVWSGYTSAGKLNALNDNNNWRVFIAGGDQVNSGERIFKQFTQTTHGFTKGDVIGFDGNNFVKVNSLTAVNIEPLGIVTKINDANNFDLTFSGYISTSGMTDVNSSGLTGGSIYYLSNVAGKLTLTKPTGTTEVAKPMLVTITDTTGVVLQYKSSYTSGNTISNEEFTGYTASTQLFLDKTVTGATNIGYFTGLTGIQILPINNLSDNSYDGSYASVYNYYYRDNTGVIRIGVPSDGIPKRGYVRTTLPAYSWIWNEYTGDTAPIGWIFVQGDVTSDLVYGSTVTGASVGFSSPAYTGATWTTGAYYNNGSQIVINTVQGSLTTGSTYINGGPLYKDKQDKNLNLRTIVSSTPEILNITYDEYFVKLSGKTSVDAVNVGTGVGVYSGVSGTTLLFKKLAGGGGTSLIDAGDTIVITSTASGGTSGDSGVSKSITQLGHGFSVGDFIGWSGGTYNKAIADGNYDGEFIGLVTEVVDVNNFKVTQSGYVTGLTGLVTNTTYFLSDTTAGLISSTEPSTDGSVVKPVLIADSTTSGWVLPYPGIVLTSSGISGNDVYTGATPAAITVGGISVGTTLTGKTYSELFEELLVPELCGTITEPSTNVVLSASGLYEIGCTLSQTVTANFNRGSINPQYCSVSPYRSGLPNAYCFTGPEDMPIGWQSCTALSATAVDSSYTVAIGTQSWGSCTRYDCGEPALGSKGTEYCAALPSGITLAASDSIIGTYPLYGTTSDISTLTKQPLQNMSTANNIDMVLVAESGGNKQKFEIPCAWLGAPTNRPLIGVCQYNTVSAQWEYPGGSATSSLNLWTSSSVSEIVQGNSVNYCRYTHNGVDRGEVCIRLVF